MVEEGGGESTLTVLLALAVNAAIGVMKAVAGLLTGSVALLAEAGHSVADTSTEGLLLAALRRSERKADLRHPFGYGKERFFWALIAAISIFVSGAVFAAIEGVRAILGEETEQTLVWVAYLVLGLSFLLESVSWMQATRQVRRQAREDDLAFVDFLRGTDDPTVKTVFFEDTAALIGLVLAFGGVGLHQLTGNSVWDGIASLLIGVLLTLVAYILGRTNKGLLIGRQADPRLVLAIYDRLAAAPEVEQVVDLLTMMTGTDKVLVCARLDFDDELGAAEVENVVVRIHRSLRSEFEDLDEIFLEPVPRTNEVLQARVHDRYGDIVERLRERDPG